MLNWFKQLPWRDIFLLLGLLIFEVAIHPLTLGPDRRIHDPAVYRLNDANYLLGDWYTNMAAESKVYTFYAALVNVGPRVGIPEELWRQTLYVLSLIVLYWSLIQIARLFTKSIWVVPLMALFHALLIIYAPPSWLYGPFMQIDGGLAPRSIGVALSFLALFFLLKQTRVLPWALLGIATLIHVSNSLIMFVLFLSASTLQNGWQIRKTFDFVHTIKLLQSAGRAFAVYLLTGGWFALFVGLQGTHLSENFTTDKFIWTWIYVRAPYMALPLVSWKMWFLFAFHVGTLLLSWHLLRRYLDATKWRVLDLMGAVGMGGVVLFFLFYLFAFVIPWLPGFQFYSLRAVYITFFTAYLFSALTLLALSYKWYRGRTSSIVGVCIALLLSGFLFGTSEGIHLLRRSELNLFYTKTHLLDLINPIAPPSPDETVARYLFLHREPFLGPVFFLPSPMYLPHVASFKTFGFTPQGLEEWYGRLNAVSRGELEKEYQAQQTIGIKKPISVDWNLTYSELTESEVRELAKKYHFKYFVTFESLNYPFTIIAKDKKYRLYEVRP